MSAPKPDRAFDFCMGRFQCWYLIFKGACCKVGNEFFFLDVLNYPWIPNKPSFKPKAREGVQVTEQKLVANLKSQGARSWDMDKLRQLFSQDTVSNVLINIHVLL